MLTKKIVNSKKPNNIASSGFHDNYVFNQLNSEDGNSLSGFKTEVSLPLI